jgi:hypothetical protein
VQQRSLLEPEQEWQGVSENVQVSVDNVRPALSENRGQSVVHAVIESRPFAKVSDLYASLVQQTVEVTTQSASERNDSWFITLTVQASRDMNCHALGTTGA